MLFRSFVALSLAPVLCAIILKDTHGQKRRKTPVTILIDAFNRLFERLTGSYVNLLNVVTTRRLVTLGAFLAFSLGIYGIGAHLPAGFIPGEDQGMIYAIIQTPPGSTIETTNKVAHELEEIAKEIEGVQSVSSLSGYEVLTEGRGSNAGTCIINLKDWIDKHPQSQINQLEFFLRKRTRQYLEELIG